MMKMICFPYIPGTKRRASVCMLTRFIMYWGTNGTCIAYRCTERRVSMHMLTRPFVYRNNACLICLSIHQAARRQAYADAPLCVLEQIQNMHCFCVHTGARQHMHADAPLGVLKKNACSLSSPLRPGARQHAYARGARQHAHAGASCLQQGHDESAQTPQRRFQG